MCIWNDKTYPVKPKSLTPFPTYNKCAADDFEDILYEKSINEGVGVLQTSC